MPRKPKKSELEPDSDLDYIAAYHDFTWMPGDPEDCPCDECQAQVDRELIRDRTSVWQYKRDWHISKTRDVPTRSCVCGKVIDSIAQYNSKKKTNTRSSVSHILIQTFGPIDIGDGIPFSGVTRIHTHTECAAKLRGDLDMENQARSILVIESLPDLAQYQLKSMSAQL